MKGAIVTPLLALYPTYTHKTKLASMSLSVLGDNTCPEKGVNACLSIQQFCFKTKRTFIVYWHPIEQSPEEKSNTFKLGSAINGHKMFAQGWMVKLMADQMIATKGRHDSYNNT